MALRFDRQVVLPIIVFVSAAITGCDQGPAYKYQSGGDAGHQASKEAATQPAPAQVAESAEPAVPELTVDQLLQSDKKYDGKKVKVSGKLGQIMQSNKMSFLIDKNDHSNIEISYGNMPSPDQATLVGKLPTMTPIAVIGVWDANKKVLAGESLVR